VGVGDTRTFPAAWERCRLCDSPAEVFGHTERQKIIVVASVFWNSPEPNLFVNDCWQAHPMCGHLAQLPRHFWMHGWLQQVN
jgi:hypothetical protein